MQNINTDRKSLRKFGFTMAVASLVIVAIMFLRHKYDYMILMACASSGFFLLALTGPSLLEPLYVMWMKFVFLLGWINTRIVLTIMFYLIFAPMAIVMRIFRVDLLDRKIDKRKDSYWKKSAKQAFNQINYERQF